MFSTHRDPQRIGLLMRSARSRLLGALALTAVLWLAVAWALGNNV